MSQSLSSLTQPPASSDNRSYKILVVDDEADARELFFDMLSAVPEYEVSTAVDGGDALAKAEATKFDLILLDIIMPVIDGIQTLTEIVNDSHKYGMPKVIMLTNIGGDVAVEEAINLGAVGYRVKVDTEPDELLRVVKDELEGEEE